MKKHFILYLSLSLICLLASLLWNDQIVSAQVTPAYPTPRIVQNRPGIVQSLSIRVDWVEISNYIGGDIDNVAELSFAVLVIRENGDAAKLILANSQTYAGGEVYGQEPVRLITGDTVYLDNFSLSVNNLGPNESLQVVFLALDEDGLTPIQRRSRDAAIGAVVEVLGDLIKSPQGAQSARRAFNLAQILPKTNVGLFILNILADLVIDEAVEYFEAADELGHYVITLKPSEGWRSNQTLRTQSPDGNMRFQFAVIGQSETECTYDSYTCRYVVATAISTFSHPTSTATATLTATRTPTSTPMPSSTLPSVPTLTRTPTSIYTTTPTRTPFSTISPTRTAIPTLTATVQSIPTANRNNIDPASINTSQVDRVATPRLVAPRDGTTIIGSRVKFEWLWDGKLQENWGFEVRGWKAGELHNGVHDAKETVGIAPDGDATYHLDIGIPPHLLDSTWQWTVAVVQLEPYRRIGSEARPNIIRLESSGTIPIQRQPQSPLNP